MQTIKLDISRYDVPETVCAKQGDVGRRFQAKLTDSDKEYSIPEGAKLSVWYSGTSGSGNYSAIGKNSAFSVNGSTVTVEIITQMLKNKGGGTLCLMLHGVDGTQLAMWNIPYIVEEVPGMGSQAAGQYYTALSEVAAAAADSAARAEAAAQKMAMDETLSKEGYAADAAAVGAALDGKAPAGYGLGYTASKHIADLSGLDALVESGFYTVVFSEGLFLSDVTDREHYVNFASVHVVAYSKENVMQQMRAIHSTSVVRRISTSEGWSEWEWENPPMVLSTEYRTLERWQGKPVYTMLVDCGGMVNGKRVDLDVEHMSILRHAATIGENSLPLNNYGTYVSAQHVGQTAIAILMYSGSESFQGMSTYTQIWYTKD